MKPKTTKHVTLLNMLHGWSLMPVKKKLVWGFAGSINLSQSLTEI